MQHTDFIIVGSGLAGVTLAHTLHEGGYKFKIISDPALSNCSMVAAGIYNPVVFFRITKSYMADFVLPFAIDFYRNIETRINQNLIQEQSIARLFTSISEQQLWEKRREEGVGIYLGEIKEDAIPSTSGTSNNPIGVVKNSGSLHCRVYLNTSLNYFNDSVIREKFDHEKIVFHEREVEYKNTIAKKIIFCEGHLISNNPFFKEVALKPVKGEVLTIKFDEALPLNISEYIINKKCFLLPLGDNRYKAGATYNWKNINEDTTPEALQELRKNVEDIISQPFSVLSHHAGVRPAAADRRPILGLHTRYPQLAIFNGLGTKGVMLAPYFANELVQSMVNGKVLHKEVDVGRFFAHANG